MSEGREEHDAIMAMADDGCPHADVPHDQVLREEPEPVIIRSRVLQETIADHVRRTPELTYWGETPRGYSIFRQENGVGGHRYWSDEIGGGVVVWDTSLGSIETMLYCIAMEHSIGTVDTSGRHAEPQIDPLEKASCKT